MNPNIKSDARTVWPVSSIQRQFWFLQSWQPETRAYHIPCLFRVSGPLDIRALELAFHDLAGKHASLRTTFEQQEGLPVQRVHTSGVLPIEFVLDDELLDLSAGTQSRIPTEFPELTGSKGSSQSGLLARQNLSRTEPANFPSSERLRKVTREFFRTPFDLAKGPLWRVRIWRTLSKEHILAWSLHHIIVDLESKGILSEDLGKFYQARLLAGSRDAEAKAAGLDSSNCEPYTSFAEYESEWLKGPDAIKCEQYFAKHLEAGVEPLAIATDRPRPPRQAAEGARICFKLEQDLVSQLNARCAEAVSKPFLMLLSAWALVLSRYSGVERLVIGVPFPNRRRKASQNISGCFVNNLPLAIQTDGAQPFANIVAQVRASMLGHHRHQELGLERVVSKINPVRDPSRSPLFQAGFTFEPPMGLQLGDASVTGIKAHAGGSQLDLFMTLWPSGDGYEGHVEFATALFDLATIARLVDNFLALLSNALDQKVFATTPCAELEILCAAERKIVVETFNATHVAYSAPARLHDLFLEQVSRTEKSLAVRFGDQTLTYGELKGKAFALAHELCVAGLRPGDHVGVFMQRSLEMVVSLIAVQLANGVYVPIDPEYPASRIEQMLEDSKPAMVLTHAPVAASWRGCAESRFLRQVDVAALPVRFEQPPVCDVPGNAAYTLFTSGSTGRPKGATNTHHGIINRILWMQEAYRLDQSDVVLQKTPFSFDVSTWEFFWPLAVGAVLEVAPPGAHRDPSALCRIIRERKVTTIHFVPSMLGAFLEYPAASECTTLRQVIASGEALSAELVRRCAKSMPFADLHNLYGPTEAAVDVTWWPCKLDLDRDPVPIGKPIANTQLYVLDARRQPVPIGVLGELYIGGIQVALGYVNRPELTRERFVPDPFLSTRTGTLYKTGDSVRWAADGNIVFLGRLDHQVKIRGLRIELGEIETAIDQFPGVRQSVVVARELGGKGLHIIAYVAVGGEVIAEAALAAHIAKLLPSYMVPEHFILMAELPLSPNGKIDRKALPEPKVKRQESTAAAEPASAIERWVRDQCQDLLGVGQVGIFDNFFEIGGTSIAVAQLAGRIHRHRGVEIPIVKIFEHPTVAALAKYLSTLLGGKEDATNLDEAKARAEKRRAAPPPRPPRR